eukprot:6303915-Pyramimonas_sp.AAC.1
MLIRCPYCRANDRGSVAALLPGAPPPTKRRQCYSSGTGSWPPIRPPTSYSEFAAATLSLAMELDCLRADLVSMRRPNTYMTVRDTQRIHEHATVHRHPPAQPEEMEVDHDSESTLPRRTEEGGSGVSNALAPPSRQERLRSIPIITQSRWASLLARHHPGELTRRGPPAFPVPLLMAAAEEVGAELVITRGPLLGDRHADSTGTTIAMAGPSAYEQIKEL